MPRTKYICPTFLPLKLPFSRLGGWVKFAVSWGRRGPDPVEWPNGVSDEAPEKAAMTWEVDMLDDFPLPSSTGKKRQNEGLQPYEK